MNIVTLLKGVWVTESSNQIAELAVLDDIASVQFENQVNLFHSLPPAVPRDFPLPGFKDDIYTSQVSFHVTRNVIHPFLVYVEKDRSLLPYTQRNCTF